jgi:prolyl oligopeptidase
MRDRKTNSIRDFIACAEYIRRRTGGPVGAEAHSAGGIVVGMAVATRPDLFGASYIDGGVLNILRFETTAAGPSNLDEFGSTKTEEGTRSLLSIDVLGAMRPGVKYPPMLLSAAANDTTVPLWQSAKVVARLQSLSNVETFISVNQDDGHGASSTASQDVERATDSWAFFSYYLHQATGAGQLTFEGSK